MTAHGKKLLEEELHRLIQEERPKVIKAIAEARSHGDLSENADYDAAKEQQAHIEGRIGEIKNRLSKAQVIDVSQIKSDVITFGAFVVLKNEELNKKVTYQIVGEDEADATNGRLSIQSPLAKKLIGRKKGELFNLQTPRKDIEYEVLDFFFQMIISSKGSLENLFLKTASAFLENLSQKDSAFF